MCLRQIFFFTPDNIRCAPDWHIPEEDLWTWWSSSNFCVWWARTVPTLKKSRFNTQMLKSSFSFHWLWLSDLRQYYIYMYWGLLCSLTSQTFLLWHYDNDIVCPGRVTVWELVQKHCLRSLRRGNPTWHVFVESHFGVISIKSLIIHFPDRWSRMYSINTN